MDIKSLGRAQRENHQIFAVSQLFSVFPSSIHIRYAYKALCWGWRRRRMEANDVKDSVILNQRVEAEGARNHSDPNNFFGACVEVFFGFAFYLHDTIFRGSFNAELFPISSFCFPSPRTKQSFDLFQGEKEGKQKHQQNGTTFALHLVTFCWFCRKILPVKALHTATEKLWKFSMSLYLWRKSIRGICQSWRERKNRESLLSNWIYVILQVFPSSPQVLVLSCC